MIGVCLSTDSAVESPLPARPVPGASDTRWRRIDDVRSTNPASAERQRGRFQASTKSAYSPRSITSPMTHADRPPPA